jgi:hypothetical protein
MEKQIKTIQDVKRLLGEIKSEINYFGNQETMCAFEKVISEWGFDTDDIDNGDI